MNLNNCQIIGRVTRDPEVRAIPNGSKVVSIGVAVNRVWKDTEGNKKEDVEFVNAVAFGKVGEIIAQYIQKGQLIYIQGRLKTDSWENKDGEKRSATKVIIENMQMGPKAANAGGSAAPADDLDDFAGTAKPASKEIDASDVPW